MRFLDCIIISQAVIQKVSHFNLYYKIKIITFLLFHYAIRSGMIYKTFAFFLQIGLIMLIHFFIILFLIIGLIIGIHFFLIFFLLIVLILNHHFFSFFIGWHSIIIIVLFGFLYYIFWRIIYITLIILFTIILIIIPIPIGLSIYLLFFCISFIFLFWIRFNFFRLLAYHLILFTFSQLNTTLIVIFLLHLFSCRMIIRIFLFRIFIIYKIYFKIIILPIVSITLA